MTTQIHPSQSTETPDLRVIPLDKLVEHEYNDVQRTGPLAERLQAEGLLKNPPIVTQMAADDPRFVVLDGANRTTALQSLGYPHVLVQVVKYEPPHVTLTTWHHVVAGLSVADFTTGLESVAGLEFRAVDLLQARAGLARRQFLSYIIRADGQILAADAEATGLHEQNELLNAMVDTYKTSGRLYRAAADHLEETRELYPDLTGLVVFPKYEPSEVLALARDGELLPTGLTRHFIQGRALRTNYPLSELSSGASLEDKNTRLQQWLKQKLASREIRFYGEATYLFDE